MPSRLVLATIIIASDAKSFQAVESSNFLILLTMQGAENNYETDLILPLVLHAAKLAGLNYNASSSREKAALKVIADHARAVTYLISDGVTPSNVGRGYVLRRLLRRAVMKVHSYVERRVHSLTYVL